MINIYQLGSEEFSLKKIFPYVNICPECVIYGRTKLKYIERPIIHIYNCA